MSRRARGGEEAQAAVDAAAAAASEAARVLQARQQASLAEKPVNSESKTEPQPETFTPVDEKKVRRGNQEREAMLAELRKARGEPEEQEKPKEEPKSEPKAESPKEEPKEPVVEAVVEAPAPEAPKMVKVKIDGVESEVSQEEVDEYGGIKGYQIAKAAENRLAKVNELVAEGRKGQSQLADIAKALLQQKPQEPQKQPSEILKAKLPQIRFGTDEEASLAFQEALQAFLPKPVDQNAVLSQALAAMEQKAARDAFKSEFPEIVSNPMLLRLAISLEQEEFAKAGKSGQGLDWRATYSKIGNQIRSAVPVKPSQLPAAPEKTASTTSSASAKEERKASIVTLPTAAARAELPKEEKPMTREESLNEMRRRRGQQTL